MTTIGATSGIDYDSDYEEGEGENEFPSEEEKEEDSRFVRFLRDDVLKLDVFFPEKACRTLSRKVSTGIEEAVYKAGATKSLNDDMASYDKATDDMTVQQFRELAIATTKRYTALRKLCDDLAANLKLFSDLEVMNFSQTGWHALDAVRDKVAYLGSDVDTVLEAWSSAYAEVDANMTTPTKAGTKLADLGDDDLDVRCFRLKVISIEAEDRIKHTLAESAQRLNRALVFQGIKAAARVKQDTTQKWVRRANNVARQIHGQTGVVGSFIPEPGRVVFGSANSIIATGLGFISRVSTTWADHRATEHIMKNAYERQLALNWLNDNPLVVAVYLKNKYVDKLSANLAMLDPLDFGARLAITTGLSVAGAGPIAGEVLSRVWPTLKMMLIAHVKGAKEAAIVVAAEKHGLDPDEVLLGKTYSDVADTVNRWATKLWDRFAEAVDADPDNRLVTELAASFSKSAGRFVALGRDTAEQRTIALFFDQEDVVMAMVRDYATRLVRAVMKKLDVQAAQYVDGNMIFSCVAENNKIINATIPYLEDVFVFT